MIDSEHRHRSMQPEMSRSNERIGMGEARGQMQTRRGDRSGLLQRSVARLSRLACFEWEKKGKSRNRLSTRKPRETILGTAVPALLTSGSVWKSRPPECLGGDGQSGIPRSSAEGNRACSERAGSSDPPIRVRTLVPRWARGASSLIQVLQHNFSFPVNVPQENLAYTQNEVRTRSKKSDIRRLDVRLVGTSRRPLLPIRSKSTLLPSVLVIPTSRENPKKLGGDAKNATQSIRTTDKHQ